MDNNNNDDLREYTFKGKLKRHRLNCHSLLDQRMRINRMHNVDYPEEKGGKEINGSKSN